MTANLPATTKFKGTLPRDPQTGLAIPPAVDAALYANVGRYAGAVVMTAFETIGGVERLAHWADQNPADFYTKVFTKTITKPQQLEVSGTISIEEAVKMLDMQEGVDYHDVTPAPDLGAEQF